MHLINKLYSKDLLRKSWRSVYKGKSDDARINSRGIDGISLHNFKKSEIKELDQLHKDLVEGSFRHQTLYGIEKLKQNKKKYRLLTVPTVRDRIVEKMILEVVKPYLFKLSNTHVSYCGTRDTHNKKKNIQTAFKKIISLVKERDFIVFESDIKSFFDEIPKEELFNKIVDNLPDDSLNQMIHDIIFFEVGNIDQIDKNGKIEKLPLEYAGISQGSPLSPLFANVYLQAFDNNLEKEFGDNMIRYVDDFIFFTNKRETAKKFHKICERELKKLKLRLPPLSEAKDSKTRFIDLRQDGSTCSFLGININKNGLWPKPKLKDAKEKFAEYLSHRKHPTDHLAKIESMNNKIMGFANYYRSFHSIPLFKQINKEVLLEKKKVHGYERLIMLPEHISKSELIPQAKWSSLFIANDI